MEETKPTSLLSSLNLSHGSEVLTPIQNQVAEDRHRFRVLRIGRRGGKTTLAVKEIKAVAVSKPTRVCYVAPTYQHARDIAWEMIKKELGSLIIQTNESRLEIRTRTIRGGESIILFRGWESVENLRGQAFDFIVIDEVAMMRAFWMYWQEVIRPTLTDTQGEVLFCSTPKGYNHFFDLANLELTDKDFKSFHFTTYDNPHIPREEIETARIQMTPDRFSQEYLADFTKTEGLVYKEFKRERHIYSGEEALITEKWTKVAGIDFGYTNPAAILHIRVRDDMFYIEEEWYKKGRTERQIAEYVAQGNFSAVYPDPESPSAIEELKNAGVNVREVVKGKDSVASGIQRIRELLIAGRIKVHTRCRNLISEFETYSYDDDMENDIDRKEKPIKFNDHALDALRYVVMMSVPQVRDEAVLNMLRNSESKSADPY